LESILTHEELSFNDAERKFILETAQHFRHDYSRGADLHAHDYLTIVEKIGSASILQEHAVSDRIPSSERILARRNFFHAHAVWELMHTLQNPFNKHSYYFNRIRSYLKSSWDETLESGHVHSYHKVLMKLTGVEKCVQELHHRFDMFRTNLYNGNASGAAIERDTAAQALVRYRDLFHCSIMSNEGFCSMLEDSRRYVVEALMKNVDDCLTDAQRRKTEGMTYLKQIQHIIDFTIVPVFPNPTPIKFDPDLKYKSEISARILEKGHILEKS
jgi:hypothetical protein